MYSLVCLRLHGLVALVDELKQIFRNEFQMSGFGEEGIDPLGENLKPLFPRQRGTCSCTAAFTGCASRAASRIKRARVGQVGNLRRVGNPPIIAGCRTLKHHDSNKSDAMIAA